MKWSRATTRSAPRRSHSKLNAPSHAPMSSTVFPARSSGSPSAAISARIVRPVRAGRDDAVTEIDRVPPPVARPRRRPPRRRFGRSSASGGSSSPRPGRLGRRLAGAVAVAGHRIVRRRASGASGTAVGCGPRTAATSSSLEATEGAAPVRSGRARRPRGRRPAAVRSGPASAATAAVRPRARSSPALPAPRRRRSVIASASPPSTREVVARPSRCRRRGCGTAGRRPASAPTSATRISTSIGFISWVKIWPRIWAYWLARLRASTSSRLYW